MRVVFYEEKRVHFPEIEFRLFRRLNFLSIITPLSVCFLSVFYISLSTASLVPWRTFWLLFLKKYIYIFIFSLDLLQKFGRQQLDQFAEFRFRGLRQSTNPVSIYRQEASLFHVLLYYVVLSRLLPVGRERVYFYPVTLSLASLLSQ